MSNDEVPARRGLIRQGDVLLVPVDGVPEGARRLMGARALVLAEGEATGHAHVIVPHHGAPQAWVASSRNGALQRFVVVTGPETALLRHEEHDPLELAPGTYEVRRQREYVPPTRSRISWRRVAD